MKLKCFAFSLTILLNLAASFAQQKAKPSKSVNTTSLIKQDQYSAAAIFGTDTKINANDKYEQFRRVWEIKATIEKAFQEGKTDMKSYVREWADASGLSDAQMKEMITDIYVSQQLDREATSNSDRWSKNQLTLKGFGHWNTMSQKDAQLVMTAGEYDSEFPRLSDSEKIALLKRLPKENLISVLNSSTVLDLELENPAIAEWIRKNTDERVKGSVANFALSRLGWAKVDPSYFELLDPTKMDDYTKCSFVTSIKFSIKQQNQLRSENENFVPLSTKLRDSLQNKLNYLPSKMKCPSHNFSKTEEINPSTLLDGAIVSDHPNTQFRVAPSNFAMKSEKCSMQKPDTIFDYYKGLKGIAEYLFNGYKKIGRSMNSGSTGDNSGCLFMSSLKLKKNGEIELQVSGIGKDNSTEVNNFKFKDKSEFEFYLSSLEADAIRKLKGRSAAATSPSVAPKTAVPSGGLGTNPWMNK